MAWLEWRGAPRTWVERLRQYLAANDLYADASTIRFQFPASVMIEGLRVYERPTDKSPLLEADRLRFGWSPVSAWRRRQHIGTLRMYGATMTLRRRPDAHATADGKTNSLSLSQINIYAWYSTNGIRLGLVEGLLHGIRIHGDAYIEPVSREPAAFSLRDFSRTLRATLSQAADRIPSMVSALHQIEFVSPPRLDFHLDWYPAHPEKSQGTFQVLGFGAVFRGVPFDRWNATVLLSNGCVNIQAVSFVQGANRCVAQGRVHLTNNMAAFHVYSTLPPQTWGCFASITNIPDWPVELRANSKSRFELWAGPAPLSQLPQVLSGWFELQNTTVRKVDVRRFFAHASRDGHQVRVDYAELNVPSLSLRGTARLEIPSLDYEFVGSIEGDPRSALPWIPEGPADVVRDLDNSEHLAASGRVAGCFTNVHAFSIKAWGWGTNFTFRSVDVTNFVTAIDYTNDTLTLRDMCVQRTEGKANGWVCMDFARQRVSFDAVSTLAPHAAARILGSNIYQFLSIFRFEGPATVSAHGQVDYATFEKTDLSGTVTAYRTGWDRFMADEVTMEVSARGRSVLFTNIAGVAYGGVFGGCVRIVEIGATSIPPRYVVQAAIENADFNRVVHEVRGFTNQPYEGTLTATVTVSGAIGEGMGRTAQGAGKLEIRRGHLFQLPLLGGLSHFLSKIYPGLGFASQTDLETHFTIADGAVCSDDIEMQGNVLSIWGKGCCRFDGDLDVVVQVKLLRRSYPAYVVRFVTFPVTKLLEFHLGGTIDDPRWRPENLPKELFLIFD